MTSLIKSKPAVVVDTNVILSGIVYGGNPEKVLKIIRDQLVIFVTSPEIEAESLTKISKFPNPDKVLVDTKALFDRRAERTVPKQKVTVCRDPKDNMFLEAALEAKANFLVTGDKDLLSLKTFKSTKILTPKEFLRLNIRIKL